MYVQAMHVLWKDRYSHDIKWTFQFARSITKASLHGQFDWNGILAIFISSYRDRITLFLQDRRFNLSVNVSLYFHPFSKHVFISPKSSQQRYRHML